MSNSLGTHFYVPDSDLAGGNSHTKVMGVIIIPFLGVTICGLVPVRVLKCKMTFARGMVVPFRVLSQKNMRGSCKFQSTDLVPVSGKKLFRSYTQNRILLPFRDSF